MLLLVEKVDTHSQQVLKTFSWVPMVVIMEVLVIIMLRLDIVLNSHLQLEVSN